MFDALRAVSLFSQLSDEDLRTLAKGVHRRNLDDSEELFQEGDKGDVTYIIESGELEILKASSSRPVLLAVRRAGEVIGEMAVLEDVPRMASAAAKGETSVLGVSKVAIDHLLATSPAAVGAMFQTVLGKVRSTESRLRQSERMAQLGTLTAGVAHELNNPASAIDRSAGQLADEVEKQSDIHVPTHEFSPSARELFEQLSDVAGKRPTNELDMLDRAELEDVITEWLESRHVEDAWQCAPELVALGVTIADLEMWEGEFGDALPIVVVSLCSTHVVSTLVREISSASVRVSDIVKGLKSYSFLDKAPAQEVDVIDGIEDTINILKQKLKGVVIVREYQAGLPDMQVYGSELNQVWTNIIDNAADAMEKAATTEPTLRIRASFGDYKYVVEIEDNGPGIDPAIQPRVFDSFFTTKAPGQGTGLGLSISYGIIVDKHRGEITVSSEPGRTTFRVLLLMLRPSEEETNDE
jgi:signal transduction histidine kinase